jgi:hypothetical protein
LLDCYCLLLLLRCCCSISDSLLNAIHALQCKVYTAAALALFAWLISHQPAVLFSHNKPATGNQPAVVFSQNKSAPAISHQPTEQAINLASARI